MINPDLLKLWSSVAEGAALAFIFSWLVHASDMWTGIFISIGGVVGFFVGVLGRKRSY